MEEVLNTAVRGGFLWGRFWDGFAYVADTYTVCLGVVGAMFWEMLAGVEFFFESLFCVLSDSFGARGHKGQGKADCASGGGGDFTSASTTYRGGGGEVVSCCPYCEEPWVLGGAFPVPMSGRFVGAV